MTIPKSETDALAQLATAIETARVATEKSEALTNTLAAVTAERDTLKASVTSGTLTLTNVTAERDKAVSDLAAVTAERDTLKAEKKTLDGAVAAELAKHGIAAGAVPTKPIAGSSTTASSEAAALFAEYEAVKGDAKALGSLLLDPVKGPKLRALIV